MKMRLRAIYFFFHLPDTASAHAWSLEPLALVLAVVLVPVLDVVLVVVLAEALALSLEDPSSSAGRILVFSSCTAGCTSLTCLWRLLVDPALCEIFTLQILHLALVFSILSKWVQMMLLLRPLTLSHIFQGRNERYIS